MLTSIEALMRLLELNDEVRSLLKSEPTVIEADWNEFAIFSDIHGYLKAVERVSQLLEGGMRVIALGDYTARSIQMTFMPHEHDSLKTLERLYELKLRYPDRLILLRGNHEDQSVHYLPVSSLMLELSKTFENPNEVEEELMHTLRELPVAALIDGNLMLHGGLPVVDLPPDGFLGLLKKPHDACREYYEIFRNAPSSSGKSLPYQGLTFNCLGELKRSSLFGLRELESARNAYGFKRLIVGHIHPSSGFREFRKLPGVYAVCSSYASRSVRKAKYALVRGESIIGKEIRHDGFQIFMGHKRCVH